MTWLMILTPFVALMVAIVVWAYVRAKELPPGTCPVCWGRGLVTDWHATGGPNEERCRSCHGTGKVFAQRCANCHDYQTDGCPPDPDGWCPAWRSTARVEMQSKSALKTLSKWVVNDDPEVAESPEKQTRKNHLKSGG